jgi:DNA gyrase subunit B
MIENYLKKIQMMLVSLFKSNLQLKRVTQLKKAREMVQNRNGGLPGKLSDCSEQDPAKCEVYLSREIRQWNSKTRS